MASGMQGSCPAIPCCSVNVYKVTLPTDGALRVEINGWTPLAGSIIAYRSLVTTPSSYSDLEFISATPGNFCGFRDSLQLGRAFLDWDAIPYGGTPTVYSGITAVFDFNNPSPSVGYFPAGDYYVLMFNENQQSSISIGSSVELTFEFAEACAPLSAPQVLNFDTLEYNAESDTISFYVKNIRTLNVNIDSSNIDITGTNASEFTLLPLTDTILAVGDSLKFQTIFTPTSGGTRTASINIPFSDINCGTSTSVSLNGYGAQAEIGVLGNNTNINNNDLSPSTNNFTDMGSVVTSTGAITKQYKITNTGSDTLTFTNNPIVSLTGNSQFVISSQPASSVLPDDTTSFEITFTPSVDGSVTTDVIIANNDINESTFTFRVEATGAERNGLHFDGTNDYVNIDAVADEMANITSWTIESWIKADPSQSGNDHIIAVNTASSGNPMLFRLDDGVLDFYDGSTSFEAGTDLRDDIWHHVAATYNNGTLTLYVDGLTQGTFTTGTITLASDNRWSLGQEFDGSTTSDFFKGAINDVRIWKTIKSKQEIADNRYCEIQSPASDLNLVAYYTFNQGIADGANTSINTIFDASSYANTGTTSYFAFSGTTSNFISATNVGVNCNSERISICDADSYTVPGGDTYSTSGVYIDTLTNSLGGDSIVYTDLSINFFQITQDKISDIVACDTIKEIAQTNYTPFASFEDTDNDWVEVNGVVDSLVNTNRSIFLWIREGDQVSSSQDVLVGINTSGTSTVCNFGIATNEQLWINDGATNRNSGVVVTDGQWHFVGYTYDEASNLTQFWVDGVAASSFSNGQSISATSRISLGQEFDGSTVSNFYDGDMAEVSIWNEALDASDIALIMETSVQASHPKYNKLKAYYPMIKECSSAGLTVKDFGPHGYDGNTTSSDIIITDTLANIPNHNAAPLYNKLWTRNGLEITTLDSLFLTGTLQAGSYNLNLELDFISISDDFTITLDPSCSGPVASITSNSNVSCNSFSDGVTTASVTGGTTPYTYVWSNGSTTNNTSSTTNTINGLTAGTYTVTITDNGGLTTTASSTITQPTALASNISGFTSGGFNGLQTSCNGYADGGMTVTPTGGTTPYTYAWNNGATTTSIVGIVAGTYTVTITDANGCTTTNNETITQPTAVVASTVIDSNISCNGSYDGGMTASATGGTSPYLYAWNNGATTASVTDLVAGTYSVTITDNSGCTSTSSGTVTQPVLLIAATVVDNNSACGNSNGGATASATGGTAPYTYAWSNTATTASIAGVLAGTYSVTVSDNSGCTATSAVTITTTAGVSASVVIDNNVNCNAAFDGAMTASGTDGATPYTYAWSNGATTASLTGLAAGTYTVTMTDNNGCTSTQSGTITEPVALSSSISGFTSGGFNGLQTSCNGYADGGMTVTPTGGTTPYTYAWNNGATTASIVGIVAGTYTVTITDANGCTTTNNETITQPTAVVSSAIIDSNISCNGQSDGGMTASATGGTSPYLYVWNNGATTASVTGLVAGTYSVTITDNSGCTSINSGTVTQPVLLIAATVVDSNISCNGLTDGGITASANGGTTPYAFAWSNGATTASIAGIAAGTYSVTITDNGGCSSTSSATITEPAAIAPPTFTGLATDYCEDAAVVTLTGLPTGGIFTGNGITGNSFDPNSANSGNNDIKYSITDAIGCESFVINSTTINNLPTVSISGLATDYCVDAADVTIAATPISGAWTGDINSNGDFSPSTQGVGTHNIVYIFTDANSCVNSDTATTMVNALPIITFTTLADVCADANNFMITGASPVGGDWSGNGVSSNYFNANNAGAGSHYLNYTYTDANGCINMDSTMQLVNPLPVLNITGFDADYCANASTDTLDATPAGGTFFGLGMTANVFDPSVVNAGSVSILYMYTDANGCFNSTPATTTINSIPMVDLGSDNTVCEYSSSMLDAGNTGSTYLWNTGATTQTIVLDTNGFGIGDFMYNVTVTNANSCINMDSVEITYEATPVSQLTDTNTICGENTDITLDAGYISGNTYVWSNGVSWSSITINANDLGANMGNMSVEITSDGGCVYNDTTFVYFREVPVIDIGGDEIVCLNHEFTIDAGTGFTSYLWNTGATTQSITIDSNTFDVGQNIIKVEVYNDVNCSAMDSMMLVVDPCTGIENNDIANKVNLYPNPNNGEFTIDISSINEDVNIEILSSYGQVIYKANHKATQNRLIEIKQNHLAKGMYYIRISNDNMNLYKKVNIQ